MNFSRLSLSIFLALFAGLTVLGQNVSTPDWVVKFDLSRLIYYYKSAEISVEKRYSPKVGWVMDFNYYFRLSDNKFKDIISSVKTKATSNTNFRISLGANFYSDEHPAVYYRTRLSYGKIQLQQRRHVGIGKEVLDGFTVCTSYKEDIVNRKMNQLMVRGGVGLKLAVSKHLAFDFYTDIGVVHYLFSPYTQLSEDINKDKISDEYKTIPDINILYSDGAIRVNLKAPQVLFLLGLKFSYAF